MSEDDSLLANITQCLDLEIVDQTIRCFLDTGASLPIWQIGDDRDAIGTDVFDASMRLFAHIESRIPAIESEVSSDWYSAVHPALRELAEDNPNIEAIRLLAFSVMTFRRKASQEFATLRPLRDSRIWNAVPALSSRVTDEDLIRLAAGDEIHQGCLDLVSGRVAVHPHLAGGRTLDWHARLPKILASLAEDRSLAVAIAIDPRIVPGHLSSFIVWKEHAWGPPLRRNDIASRGDHRLTVTIHKRPEERSNPMFAQCWERGVKRTEFAWSSKGGIRTFHCFELIESERNTIQHGRYMHSEFDLARGNFGHIDGAVLMYPPEHFQQLEAMDSILRDRRQLPRPPKPKLFRIDALDRNSGGVSVDDWSRIVRTFFCGNPLVGEYLGGITDNSTVLSG